MSNLEKKEELVKRLKLDQYYKESSWAGYNRALFDHLAKKYDAGNLLHAFGTKGMMDRKAVERLPVPTPARILDLCTGSGDIAAILARRNPRSLIIGFDASGEMLKVAEEKLKGLKNIMLVQGDAMHMPYEDNSFDAVITSYGLRNLTDLEGGLKEIYRVLKPGGYFSSVDLGKPQNRFWRFFHRLYFYNVAPLLGKIFFHLTEFNSFRYLAESSHYFPEQPELMEQMRQVGFQDVKNYDYIFGAVAQQVALKPHRPIE